MKMERGEAVWWWYCPGCDMLHPLPDDGWTFNGDSEVPTFTPSFLHNWRNGVICHYTITDGYINYHSDCTHEKADQTILMPHIPE